MTLPSAQDEDAEEIGRGYDFREAITKPNVCDSCAVELKQDHVEQFRTEQDYVSRGCDGHVVFAGPDSRDVGGYLMK